MKKRKSNDGYLTVAKEEEIMMTVEMKRRKRMEKIYQLEQGCRQFCSIPSPDNRAYVWVGNVTFPVPVSR